MDWILTPLAFNYAFHNVKPAKVVDKCIEYFLKIFYPSNSNHHHGRHNWLWKGIRKLEHMGQKAEKEIQIRQDIRRFDHDLARYGLSHDLIIRYISGILASQVTLFVIHVIRRDIIYYANNQSGGGPRRGGRRG